MSVWYLNSLLLSFIDIHALLDHLHELNQVVTGWLQFAIVTTYSKLGRILRTIMSLQHDILTSNFVYLGNSWCPTYRFQASSWTNDSYKIGPHNSLSMSLGLVGNGLGLVGSSDFHTAKQLIIVRSIPGPTRVRTQPNPIKSLGLARDQVQIGTRERESISHNI